ncbi:uncharacterized protein LOC110628827 isoform X2 [Manihot esculenta]|uniref:Uncharacterized protein n=3 Tax=Manihot esculenta TaxID=3983 RepID=A0ACB7GNW5_MANES|nr:uncharacterized protein LOC110628827 isoform X2 [Manihot esculenta]KAG8642043.1 hypothetical protein MANES_12G055800v8 [Manihot esculenta]
MNINMTTPVSEKHRLHLRRFLPTIFLLSATLLIGSAFVITDYKEKFSELVSTKAVKDERSKLCETQNKPRGSDTLPGGIISATSDLQMRPLWGHQQKNSKKPSNLLAMAVGIKQKDNVNKIVKKFLSSDFAVMFFHYDEVVDEWKDFEWNRHVIHIAAASQTKWWFAKRFLHPDIVSEYAYIFLWDEDIGVDYFNPGRYLSIIKPEGLEISQPALDPNKSEVHHHLTKRRTGSRVHRRIDRKIGGTRCDKNVTGPPCSGFVEMMAPVFSKASWRCAWYMIQNDLIQGWGVDFQLGYCAQGDRTKNIGIVDSEYIIHFGLPTLGGSAENKTQPSSKQSHDRQTVKHWSFIELEMFKNRWRKAASDDHCWSDPYRS